MSKWVDDYETTGASMKTIKKLELTWIGKDQRPKLEPRVLIEDTDKSYHAKQRVSDEDTYDNKLIFGDNLLALKALEQEYTGKVKCIYIDPPYNTGSAFEHYDDGVEHSIWLSLMKCRIELLYKLLADDGSLWISVDDNECHYLKVLCDEIFDRANYIATIIWQKKHTRANDARWLSDNHDFILCYAKEKLRWKRNLLPQTDIVRSMYKNPDNDPRGVWASGPCHAKTPNQKDIYEVIGPNGITFTPPPGTSWRFSKERFFELIADNRIYFGEQGKNVPRYKRFLTEVQDGLVPVTIWLKDEVGDNQESKKEVKSFNQANVFSTPKPERLINRILQISSNPGDLVLDSFAGSGTTGAVAHKLGRRWIMVELGEHCHTHIIPRLQKVIDGTDQGGISKAVGWKGGGGFRYYRLAPSLLEKDKWGNWIINKEYNKELLAEAVCKLEGFCYAPSDTVFWQHGHSSESDFIYVTTQNLNAEQLRLISEEVGSERSLLVLCSAFQAETSQFANLTVKKIPKHVLHKCEYGKDDYSLNVQNLPLAEKEEKQSSFLKEEDLA
ncbi:MAG: site-specific DNA-methyltransferase [Candidatus Cloacimonas sp.]|nr:site-specific DNA-methyltransferase [Candidatus Cloacimonas sp.]